MNLVQRAWKKLNLTPGERALLQFAEGTVVTALVAALTAAATYLGTNGTDINLNAVLTIAGGAFAKTLWDTISKYQQAKGQPPLAQPNDTKTPDPAPAQPMPAPDAVPLAPLA